MSWSSRPLPETGVASSADKVASQVRDSDKHKAASDKLSDEELGEIAKAVAAM